MIPRIETERLLLREWRAADFEAFSLFMGDPEVMRFLTGEPMARGDAWRSLASVIGHWHLRGYGSWAVERKTDGVLLGRVGMVNPEGWPGVEIGWTLARPYWGNGYATEAARAAMRYAFVTQPLDKLISVINPDNAASQRVAMRLGATRGPRYDVVIGGEVYPAEIWSIERSEWQKRAFAV